MSKPPDDHAREFEKALSGRDGPTYVLRLYVTGTTARSVEAIANIKEICEKHLQGRYQLEIVDLYEHPERASHDQVVAIPTLVKELPKPLRRFIGDLSARDKILAGLDLIPKSE